MSSAKASINYSHSLFNQLVEDYQNYYSIDGLKQPLAGIAIGGITANAEFDAMFRDFWQKKIRTETTDDISNIVDAYSKLFHVQYSLPVYALSMLAPNEAIQGWGNYCFRMLALGAPQQAILTSMLGSSRPEQGKPQWHPYQYNRAVSGHAFYGAVPILAIAELQANKLNKYAFYALSTVPGWARINQDKHYFTQAFLGWWLAYCASRNIYNSNKSSLFLNQMKMSLNSHGDGIYLEVQRKF